MHELLWLVFLLYAYYIFIIAAHDINEQFLLCKHCGAELAAIKSIINKKTPLAIRSWNDSTLFHAANHGKTHAHEAHTITSATMIQLVKNPHGSHFKLITVANADLHLINESTSEQDTWFPGYKWTIALCPQCLTHVGWRFDKTNAAKDDEKSFFALILNKLLDEDHADTLIIQPKLKMY
jgi:hypothetical protein